LLPDQFAVLVRTRAGMIQNVLNHAPNAAKEPAVISIISVFWYKVAQAVIEGYHADRLKALQDGRQDGNRRFLELALGAIGAEWYYHPTELSSAKTAFNGLIQEESDSLIRDFVPFPKEDHLEPADSVPSQLTGARLANTNYLWQTFPIEVYNQSIAACVLPKVLKVPMSDGEERSNVLWMVLVPDVDGSLHSPRSDANDIAWRPAAPFYMAVTETSFADMRLYQDWARRTLPTHPEWARFMVSSATKKFVGDQSAPYTGVRLDEALSFCNWLSLCHGREPIYTQSQDGHGSWTQGSSRNGFRLPTDTEWQFAARFGFDFFADANTPTWKQIKGQLYSNFTGNLGTPEAQAARRLVFSSTLSQPQTVPRLVDDTNALLYPLGMRDLCGNAGELCLNKTSPASSPWVVCGGSCDVSFEDAVMPWAMKSFNEEKADNAGFRVVLPVPMDHFVIQ
jgi:formylglycine-generating enzyme required for sulfatase activity